MNQGIANVRIVLCRTSHPGNIGAAARAMKTMGLSSLYLVSPKSFPHSEATARASGAEDLLEQCKVSDTLDDALSGVRLAVAVTARSRDLSHEVFYAREAARIVLEEAGQGDVALVFGTEMSGLTNEEVGKCRIISTIPANPEYSSLNLAAAVQIMAYELRMAGEQETVQREKPLDLATFDEIEHFYQHLEETLVKIGFLDPEEPKRLMPRLRRLFARSRLEKTEVNILRGILRDLTEYPKEQR